LYSRFFDHSVQGDFFIFRCVLPHISRPWEFLDTLARDKPIFALIEFQNLEFIFNHQLWYRISHDHVNLFSFNSFQSHFKILTCGYFADKEWCYCLIQVNPKSGTLNEYNRSPQKIFENEFEQLQRAKQNFINKFIQLKPPLYIYGGAGTGALLTFALVNSGIQPAAVLDKDPSKQGKYLEGSGIRVIKPTEIQKNSKATILVANPSHLHFVRETLRLSGKVTTPLELSED
jgi:hypothetical protein